MPPSRRPVRSSSGDAGVSPLEHPEHPTSDITSKTAQFRIGNPPVGCAEQERRQSHQPWTDRSFTGPHVGSVASHGTRLVAVGQQIITTSTDGVSWTNVALPDGLLDPAGVTWNGTEWVVVSNLEALFATSPDGLTRTGRPMGPSRLWSVASSGTRDVAVGGFGTVLTRP